MTNGYPEVASRPTRRRGWVCWLVVLLVAMHTALVLRQFPPSSIWNGQPLISGDLSWHFASVVEGDRFVAGQHRISGYSPTFMAGYPWGAWNSFSKRGYEFATLLMPGVPVERVYYICVFLCAWLTPFLLPLAAAIFGFGRRIVTGSFVLTVLVYQFGAIVTYFWTHGNVMFPFTSAMVLVYGSLFYRACESSWVCVSLSGLLLGVLFWLHPLVMVPAGVVSLIVVLSLRAAVFRHGGWYRVLVVGVLAGLVVLPWILLLMRFQEARGEPPAGLPSGVKHLVMDLFSDRAYGHAFDRRTLLHVLMVLSGLGFYGAWRRLHRHSAKETGCIGASGNERSDEENTSRAYHGLLVVWFTALVLLASTYLFAYIAVFKQMQPYRYLVTTVLFLLLPASLGLGEAARIFRAVNRAGKALVLCVLVALLPGLTGYGWDVLYRRPAQSLSVDQRNAVVWLQGRQQVPGRILCEDGVLGNLLPYFTNREVIGGFLGEEGGLVHRWVSVSPTRAFGRSRVDGEALTREEWRQALGTYNIALIVSCTSVLAREIEALPEVGSPLARFGELRIFAVGTEGSYVFGDEVSREVRVSAEANRIIVEAAPKGRFVLKYHFLDSLSGPEGVRLFPETKWQDPVPFLGVDNAAGFSRLEIVGH